MADTNSKKNPMRKIINKNTYRETDFLPRKSELPSLTVPDQTMSLRTILQRHSRGLPVTGADPKNAHYDELADGVDWRKLDIVERQEYIEFKKAELKEIQDKVQAEKQQRKAMRDEAKRRENEELIAAAKKQLKLDALDLSTNNT